MRRHSAFLIITLLSIWGSLPILAQTETIEIPFADATAALAASTQAVEGYREELSKQQKGSAEFEKAAEGLARNLQSVGVYCSILKRYQEAITAYDEAVKVSRENLGKVDSDLLWKRAQAYERVGQYERVVTELEPLLKAERRPDIVYTLALAYRQLGRGEEAAKLFAEVLKVRPDYNTAFLLGYTYNELEKYEDAVVAYRKAIELIDKQDTATLGQLYNNLGIAYKSLCRKPEAKAAFEEAAKIDKRYAEGISSIYRCKAAGSN